MSGTSMVLRYAIARGRAPLVWATLLGATGGLAATGLLAVTARALGAGVATPADVAAFVGLVCGSAVVRYYAATISLRFTQNELAEMAYELSRVVLRAPLRRVEELGGDRLMAALTDDLNVIARAVVELPLLVTNAVIVIGCFGYLALFSWKIVLLVLVSAALALAPHTAIAARAQARFTASRDERNELMGHYRALTDGISELKLHAPRRAAFLRDALGRALRRIETLTLEGQSLYTLANSYRQAVFMLAAAPIVFAAPFLDLDRAAATGAVLALFYLRGPMDAVMSAFPTIARADVALQSYRKVLAALPAEQADDDCGGANAVPLTPVREIALRRVRYAYAGSEGFTIGPIDLTIRAGEILFIAGGNGSGKTTLAKVIAGLYEQSAGTVSIDGMAIDTENRDRYRQLISGVFARFHLFRQLFGVDPEQAAGRAGEWLRRLDLHRDVRIERGAFSTLDLSTGQRKRMALLLAMIDDRPICLFDEWAAEQDPLYREEFYTRILPDLKARGKIVVVITHDDRYFAIGDRLVRMERGEIVWQGRPRDEHPAAAATQGG